MSEQAKDHIVGMGDRLADEAHTVKLESRIQTWDMMMEQAGSEMAFEIEKMDPDGKTTFSAEAFDALMENVKLWIGTRLMRYWEEGLEPPDKMTVLTTVSFDNGEEDNE